MNDIKTFENKYIEEGNIEKLKYLKQSKEYLGKMVKVVVDRPLGSKPIKEHPDFVYELNYGFVPGTMRRRWRRTRLLYFRCV